MVFLRFFSSLHFLLFVVISKLWMHILLPDSLGRPGHSKWAPIGATSHTHTDWSLVCVQKYRRRHIAININCTHERRCRTGHQMEQIKIYDTGSGVLFSRSFIEIAECTFFGWNWFGVCSSDRQLMVGSTWCARDTNHYDAIKVCRADYVFISDVQYIVAVISGIFHHHFVKNLFSGTIDTESDQYMRYYSVWNSCFFKK